MEKTNVPTMYSRVSHIYWANKNFLRGLKFARLTNIYNECGVIALSEVRSSAWFIGGHDEKSQGIEMDTLIALLVDYFERVPAELFIEDELYEGGSSDE